MHRFYVPGVAEADKSVIIDGEDVNHIKNVLRLRAGDEITVGDGSGRDYTCIISEVSEERVIADIIDINDNAAELACDITLFQGLPKADKMEFIIEKAVEIGATSIVPVMMDRSVVKLDDKKKIRKLERYNLIAESASKQSRRGIIPEVKNFMQMKEAIQFAKAMDMIIVPYESAEGMDYSLEVFKKAASMKKVGIFIGPEGGFADNEIEELKKEGAYVVSLGHRILRTETAGLTSLSILSFLIETR